jgi:hypothetical protein
MSFRRSLEARSDACGHEQICTATTRCHLRFYRGSLRARHDNTSAPPPILLSLCIIHPLPPPTGRAGTPPTGRSCRTSACVMVPAANATGSHCSATSYVTMRAICHLVKWVGAGASTRGPRIIVDDDILRHTSPINAHGCRAGSVKPCGAYDAAHCCPLSCC